MKNGSQFGEDLWIMENLALPERGTFVDVGAADGFENSNTFRLQQGGWRGILIEPHPTFRYCLHKRAAAGIIFESCVVSTLRGFAANFRLNKNPTWSGLLSEGRVMAVQTDRLDSICECHDVGKIDLLSIDTEGTELDVWRSLTTIRPTIVIIEFSTPGQPDRKQETIDVFTADGYELRHTTEVNLIFSLREQKDKAGQAASVDRRIRSPLQ